MRVACILTAFIFLLFGCEPGTSSFTPQLKNDQFINKLKQKYQCESIRFDSTSEVADSTLTITLINSKQVSKPTTDDDETFKKVAKELKANLQHPGQYKFYTVIFEQRKWMLLRPSVNAVGMGVRADEI